MAVFITKESNSTLISLRSSTGNREDYYINTPVNLTVDDNILKIIFDGNNNGMDQDILTIDYNEINDKLGTSTLSEYIDLTLISNYFGGSTSSINSSNLITGWAQYNDDQYVTGSRLDIAQGITAIIDINGASTIKTQLPAGVTDFYDVSTSKITPENIGDGYTFTMSFKGSSSSNNGGATFGVDIGGSIGQIFKRNFRFPRGIGIDHEFYFTSQGYSLGTFVANGGIIKIKSDTGTSSFYDFSLQVHRTHKAV